MAALACVPVMSVKRQSKVQRRIARKRKTASRAKAAPHAEGGASAQGLAHRDPLKPSGLFAGRALYERGPGEEHTWDYGFDDHGWFVVPRAGEPFAFPLTAELESSWELLAEQHSDCAPIAERIRVLRAAGRTEVQAALADVFWNALLPDGSIVCLESASDDEPASVSCPELANDTTVGFLASELGFERFDGEVALQAYPWMAADKELPVALARRVGERWTAAYRVRVYDDSSGGHAGSPPELCPPRPCSAATTG